MVEFSALGPISGIPDSDMDTVQRLYRVWIRKYERNALRTEYYNAHERVKNLGIAVPDKLASRFHACVGWPAKAVKTLADLSVFDGFHLPDGEDTHGVEQIMDANRFDLIVPETIINAYTHSCAFLTVFQDPDDGRRVRVIPRPATWSAAIWDYMRNRIKAALTITDIDEYGDVTDMNIWLPNMVYRCFRNHGAWKAVACPNDWPYPTVVPVCYDPQAERPFGRSRITRPLMALTDAAIRTMLRMEVGAEFYSAPSLWFLGLDPEAFQDKWSSLVSSINSVSRDQNDEIPTLQQVRQMTMQPHSDMLRTIALMVSSETSIPVNDLGITMDNPASAEAMMAAERKLSREADRQNHLFSYALEETIRMVVCLQEHIPSSDMPDTLTGIRCQWQPTKEISIGARADAFSKIAGVSEAFARSETGWRYAGFDHDDIADIMDTIRSQDARGILDRLVGDAGKAQKQDSETQQADATETRNAGKSADVGTNGMKAKFDALGVAVRAGVYPANAASLIGLDGVRFTGLQPVSLKNPDSE